MKNKFLKALVLTSALLCGIMLGGYAGDTSVDASSGNFTFLGKAITEMHFVVYEFKDNETGVHYLSVYDGGGLQPRYNADGTLYCD